MIKGQEMDGSRTLKASAHGIWDLILACASRAVGHGSKETLGSWRAGTNRLERLLGFLVLGENQLWERERVRLKEGVLQGIVWYWC